MLLLSVSVECECDRMVFHTHTAFLDATTLRRTAAVMRNRRNVANAANVDACGCQRPNRRLTARAGAGDAHVDSAKAVVTGSVGGVLGCLLGREGSSLTRATEAQGPGTLPAQRIADRIGDGDDGVVERSLNVNQTEWHILSLTLFELLVLARLGRGALLLCH